MLKKILLVLLPMLLPTILYYAAATYVLWYRRKRQQPLTINHGTVVRWPWPWLLLAGVLCTGITLFLAAYYDVRFS